jgi:hypothetical protein
MASRNFVDIPFGPYAPDFGGAPNPAAPGYLVDITGCRPTPNGLRAVPLFANISSSIAVPAGTTYGRIYAAELAGVVSVFACTATAGPPTARIHQSNDLGVSWTDVEESPVLNVAPGLWADFCQFGEVVLATSKYAEGIHYKDLTDTFILDTFAEVPDSPPPALTIARVRDSVVIGNTGSEAAADTLRSRVQWSAIGTYDDWPTPGTSEARSKQAGEQYLSLEFGQITKIVGGEKFGLIFQQRAVTRMTYVGGSAVFEFDTFEKANGTGYLEQDTTGTTIPHPVIQARDKFIWVNSTSGVYMTDGYSVRKISLGKFDTLFSGGASNWSGAYDARTNTVLLIYQGNSSKYFLYNIDTDQMGLVSDSSMLSVCAVPTTAGDLDLLNISSSLILQKQTSATQQTLSVQTGYIELDPGYRVQLQGAHLLGPGTAALTLAYKTAASESACNTSQAGFTTLTAATLGQKRTGRDSAQYLAFRITGVPLAATPMVMRGIRVYFERVEAAP